MCTGLTFLDLSDCSHVKDISPLTACTMLQILDLNGLDEITDISALAACSLLEELIISSEQLSDLSALAACVNLIDLNLNNCIAIKTINPLGDCLQTRSLATNTPPTLSTLLSINALPKCPAIKWLHLSNCPCITDITPLDIFHQLQALDLSWCSQISNLDPLKGCSSLCNLFLMGMAPVSAFTRC